MLQRRRVDARLHGLGLRLLRLLGGVEQGRDLRVECLGLCLVDDLGQLFERGQLERLGHAHAELVRVHALGAQIVARDVDHQRGTAALRLAHQALGPVVGLHGVEVGVAALQALRQQVALAQRMQRAAARVESIGHRAGVVRCGLFLAQALQGQCQQADVAGVVLDAVRQALEEHDAALGMRKEPDRAELQRNFAQRRLRAGRVGDEAARAQARQLTSNVGLAGMHVIE